jgi:hypothetical protein
VPVSKILFMASLLHWFMTIHWFVVSRTGTFTPCAMVGRLCAPAEQEVHARQTFVL